jgi:hypothetical protein
VGFVNQATDTKEHKDRVIAKFREDLDRASKAIPTPNIFVFCTNVNLTIGEKDSCVAAAKAAGLMECEIFDRERLRITLDSPDGFSIRFQFLGIPLSPAEQATFFAKWGDDIHSVIATGFHRVEKALRRLIFLQEASEPLDYIHVGLGLDRAYHSDEIGHFRAFCHILLKEPKHSILTLLFGTADGSSRFRKRSRLIA